MSYTNSTPNYNLPQWIGTDKPTFLGDFNSAFSAIDTQMKANADASTAATATANTAAATATSANTNATTALNTANSAASEAASATSAAASATSTANTASTNAAAALRASAANTIENLAPAYDPTLTYSVGDLVTYIDDQNSGKLYKCIVAVTSPMDFNVNYWDDVTTSEVYNRKSQILGSVTADGVKTIRDILNDLYAFYDKDTNAEYILSDIYNDVHVVRHHNFADDNRVTFTSIAISSINYSLQFFEISESNSHNYLWNGDGTGVNFVDESTTAVPSNGRVYSLIKLSTL